MYIAIAIRLMQHEPSITGQFDDPVRSETLQGTSTSLDVAIPGIEYEMEMVGHNYISDNLTGPLLHQSRQNLEEDKATAILSENRHPIDYIAGNKVKGTRQIEIGPFASHKE